MPQMYWSISSPSNKAVLLKQTQTAVRKALGLIMASYDINVLILWDIQFFSNAVFGEAFDNAPLEGYFELYPQNAS